MIIKNKIKYYIINIILFKYIIKILYILNIIYIIIYKNKNN